MRRQSNPWVLLIGAAIISLMLVVSLGGNIAVKTVQKATENQRVFVGMKKEFHSESWGIGNGSYITSKVTYTPIYVEVEDETAK